MSKEQPKPRSLAFQQPATPRMLLRTENQSRPSVSVVIPTYNSGRFVADAITSVLEQTCPPCEIIVVDDGSTDSTEKVLRCFNGKIKYLRQANLGPSAARNAGINAAQGEYICFLDADDLWVPQKLELQVSFMEAHRDVGILVSDHEEFNSLGVTLDSFLGAKKFSSELRLTGPIHDAFMKLVIENFVSTPTVMLRKMCLDKSGLFDESLRSVEDRDLWLRIAANFKLACLPKVVCKRRLHNSNVSKEYEPSMRGRIKVLEKNRKLFSNLAPRAIWQSQLADAYCQLSYICLEKNQRAEAIKAALTSLTHALAQIFTGGSFASYPWMLGIGAIPASLMGWRVSQRLWRGGNHFFGKARAQSS